MKDILSELRSWMRDGEDVAMATLVKVEGSAPRLPGARFICTASGKMAGSVSAGCVENDVFERAAEVLRTRKPVVARYDIAEEDGPGIGLTCGGTIEVLIDTFEKGEPCDTLLQALENDRAVALAAGLAPASIIGREMLVLADGECSGSLGAGLDAQVIGAVNELPKGGGSRILEVSSSGEATRIFVEAIAAARKLVVVGATHVAIPLCRMAKVLGFHITVVDPRRVYATPERLPDADELVRLWPKEAFESLAVDGSTHVVVLTHDSKFDIPTFERILRSDVAYIGAMASRRTHAKRLEQLRSSGYSDAELSRIHSPVGLDLGGRGPEEIALAILAELTAVRYGRERERVVPSPQSETPRR